MAVMDCFIAPLDLAAYCISRDKVFDKANYESVGARPRRR
jgi:hypothetical protein